VLATPFLAKCFHFLLCCKFLLVIYTSQLLCSGRIPAINGGFMTQLCIVHHTCTVKTCYIATYLVVSWSLVYFVLLLFEGSHIWCGATVCIFRRPRLQWQNIRFPVKWYGLFTVLRSTSDFVHGAVHWCNPRLVAIGAMP